MVISGPLAMDQSDLDTLLATKHCPKCDLSGADLSGTNLIGVNISGANLE
ncbi:uncharacterized protein METZ01_LOCUS182955, partial [marine metagenome]